MHINPEDIFYVAAITGAHGIKGEFKVKILSDKADRLSDLEYVYIVSEGKRDKISGPYKIEHLRGHGNTIVKLSGIDVREVAMQFKGSYLSITRDMSYDLSEGEYFVSDLLNLKVLDTSQNVLGKIIDIIDGAASDLFVIKRQGKKDLYVPAIPEYTEAVDLKNGTIILDLPKGLLEIYE